MDLQSIRVPACVPVGVLATMTMDVAMVAAGRLGESAPTSDRYGPDVIGRWVKERPGLEPRERENRAARTYPVGGPGAGVDRTSAPSCPKRAGGEPRFLFGRLGHALRPAARRSTTACPSALANRTIRPHPDRQREAPVRSPDPGRGSRTDRSKIDPRVQVLACRRDSTGGSGGRLPAAPAQTRGDQMGRDPGRRI
jgi:hypothetical protein